MEKKISVVVVTYNGEIWIKKNIDSLLKSNYPIDVIVVDNASTDQSIALLKDYKNIQLIQNNTNLGFGKANNIGIDIAIKNGADALFLLKSISATCLDEAHRSHFSIHAEEVQTVCKLIN